jgi:hypothetical protein
MRMDYGISRRVCQPFSLVPKRRPAQTRVGNAAGARPDEDDPVNYLISRILAHVHVRIECSASPRGALVVSMGVSGKARSHAGSSKPV